MRHKTCLTPHWIVIAEHALLRSLVVVTGLMLIIVSLAFDAMIIMLPAGLALGVVGVGLIFWGVTRDVMEG